MGCDISRDVILEYVFFGLTSMGNAGLVNSKLLFKFECIGFLNGASGTVTGLVRGVQTDELLKLSSGWMLGVSVFEPANGFTISS
jgi:hypothetical protein